MHTLLVDELRAAFAFLRRNVWFTSALVAVLGIAIGASVAMFSVFDAVVLRPLPFDAPDRLVWLWSTRPDGTRGPFSIQDFVDLQDRDTGVSALAAFAPWNANLSGVGTPERIPAMRTSANAFDVLRIRPLAGRTFRPEDGDNGGAVVLGYPLWARRFGSDPAVVGQPLSLNGVTYTIVGVLPSTFVFPVRGAELVVPIVEAQARRTEGTVNFLRLIARLRAGVTLHQAERNLSTAAVDLSRLRPQTNARKTGIALTDLHTHVVGEYAPTLRLLFSAVAILLLLASVNLAGLTLARTSARHRELAIRAALGVSRARLATQLIVESVIVAALGGGIGLVIASASTRMLVDAAPSAMPRAAAAGLDARVALFGIVVTLLSGLTVGVAPALYHSRVDPASGLRGSGRSTASAAALTIRRWLVGAEVALSVVLAIATVLLIESYARISSIDPGFDTSHVLSVRVSLGREHYPTRARLLDFQRRFEERLTILPGVQRAGGVSLLPMSGFSATVDVVAQDRPASRDAVPEAQYRVTSSGYFDTMGIRLLAGRVFSERDATGGVEVAIVNQTLADRFWPGQSAVGRHLIIEPEIIRQDVEVVGVVGDVKHAGLDGGPTMDLYVPFAQVPERFVVWMTNNQFWTVRTADHPQALASAVRAALAEADPEVPAADLRTLDQAVDASLAVRRFTMWIVALFGYAALGLTGCGIYAVSAQAVAERSQELGIRVALGAPARALMALVVRADLACVLVGIGLGVVAARVLAPVLSGMLFGVAPTDAGVYGIVATILVGVAAAACGMPAIRAARIDPVRELRL